MINEVDSVGEGAINQDDFMKIIAYQKYIQEQEEKYDS